MYIVRRGNDDLFLSFFCKDGFIFSVAALLPATTIYFFFNRRLISRQYARQLNCRGGITIIGRSVSIRCTIGFEEIRLV